MRAILRRRRPVQVRLPCSGVRVFESAHASDFVAPAMRHPYHKLIVPITGEGRVTCEAGELGLDGERVGLIPHGIEHRLHDAPGKPLDLLVACFTADLIRGAGVPDHVEGRCLTAALRHETRSLFQRMLREQSQKQPGRALMLAGLTQQIIAVILRAPFASDRLEESHARQAVRGYIERLEHAPCAAVDLATAAKRVGLSRRRFTDVFRELTGTTHRRYVERLRIERAKRSLANTTKTVAATAYECGFNDLSSFYRAYRRIEGESPLASRPSR